MKYITGGFVSEAEAGQRLFQVAHDPRCSKSGVYWSWNGGPREGRGEAALENDGQILGGGGGGGGWDSIYENDQSDKVLNKELGLDLFKYSSIITGAEWPLANQPKSPCPTLAVVGSITKAANSAQEAKRMEPAPGMVGGLAKKGVATVADAVIGKTIGGGFKSAQSMLLGELPDEAKTGSFQEEVGLEKKESGRKRAWVKAKAKGLVNFVLRRQPEEAAAEQDAALTAVQVARPPCPTLSVLCLSCVSRCSGLSEGEGCAGRSSVGVAERHMCCRRGAFASQLRCPCFCGQVAVCGSNSGPAELCWRLRLCRLRCADAFAGACRRRRRRRKRSCCEQGRRRHCRRRRCSRAPPTTSSRSSRTRPASTRAPPRPSPAPTGPRSAPKPAANGPRRKEGWRAPGAQYTRASPQRLATPL